MTGGGPTSPNPLLNQTRPNSASTPIHQSNLSKTTTTAASTQNTDKKQQHQQQQMLIESQPQQLPLGAYHKVGF